MDLRIHTQDAQIGLKQTQGQFHIQQGNHIFNLRAKEPKIYLHQEEPVLLIDQRQCFSEAGLKSNAEISRLYAAKGRQAALRATAEIANEGRAMANIQNGVIIGRLAKRKSQPKERQYNFDMIPKSRPDIDLQRGRIDISFQKGDISVDSPYRGADIYYSKGDTKVYLKQKNYINIEYIGKNVDIYGG